MKMKSLFYSVVILAIVISPTLRVPVHAEEEEHEEQEKERFQEHEKRENEQEREHEQEEENDDQEEQEEQPVIPPVEEIPPVPEPVVVPVEPVPEPLAQPVAPVVEPEPPAPMQAPTAVPIIRMEQIQTFNEEIKTVVPTIVITDDNQNGIDDQIEILYQQLYQK